MSKAKSRGGPIPAANRDEFFACMTAANDNDLPDGAWFAVLEEAAERFMRANRIRGCANSAVHQWIEANGSKQ